jgi:hypothetical protein
MTNQHLITPPPELVQQWAKQMIARDDGNLALDLDGLATSAARWGADQQLHRDAEQINQAWQKGADHELEACCEYLTQRAAWEPEDVQEMRDLCRPKPKPPSLKAQALTQVESFACSMETLGMDTDLIRRALEALDD